MFAPVSASAADSFADTVSHRTYLLSGPVARPEPTRVPLRGDLAHVGLAGRYFVPHYAVPQPRYVGPSGAAVLAAPHAGADVLEELAAGATFDVLDIVGAWAWGCLSLDGPVGYVALDRLAKTV